MSHHVVITGTGRSGTTFLVELLTKLGLDTGFEPTNLVKHETARAGLEINLIEATSPPYIIKDPAFGVYLDQVFQRNDLILDHIFIAVRDINAAAESRRYVEEHSNKDKYKTGGIPGGLTGTVDGKEQEIVLKDRIFELIYGLANTDCDLTLLKYPLMTQDPAYLFDKMSPILSGISFDRFCQVFNSVVNPALVNKFNENDTAGSYIKYKSGDVKELHQTPERVYVQLFIDYGKGFSEKDSIITQIDKSLGMATFDLPSDNRIRRLRFDPANEPCMIVLDDVKAVMESGEVFKPDITQTNGYLEDGIYYFPNNDGQWQFAINNSIQKIEFRLEYLQIGPMVKTLSMPIIERQLKLQVYKLKKQLGQYQQADLIMDKQNSSILNKIKNRWFKK